MAIYIWTVPCYCSLSILIVISSGGLITMWLYEYCNYYKMIIFSTNRHFNIFVLKKKNLFYYQRLKFNTGILYNADNNYNRSPLYGSRCWVHNNLFSTDLLMLCNESCLLMIKVALIALLSTSLTVFSHKRYCVSLCAKAFECTLCAHRPIIVLLCITLTLNLSRLPKQSDTLEIATKRLKGLRLITNR